MIVSADDLRAQALDSLQALVIFVTFVTVLFGLRYSAIAAGSAKTLSGLDKKMARKQEKVHLKRLLWSQCVPLTALIGVPFYLFLPLSLRIVRHSALSLWRFDTIRTGFVLLTAYVAAFFAWSLWLIFKLAWKAYKE